MALFDTNEYGGLFDNLPNIFMTPDFAQTGILTDEQQKSLRNQATKAGLLGTALTYFATPQTGNYGSIVPYLAKAGLGGMGAAQDVYGAGLTNLYRQRLSAGRDNEFSNINPLDVTPESLKAYQDSIAQGKPDRSLLRRAAPVEKPESFTDAYKNISLLEFGTANPAELTKEQRTKLSSMIKGAEKTKATQDYTEPQLDQLTGKYVFLPKRPGLPIKDLQGNIVTDIKLPEKAGEKLTEGERTAGFLSTRLNNSLNQLKTVTGEKPSAASPNVKAEAIKFFTRSDYLKNLANPESRQQVEAAQYDILDSALTLGTGAAYTREQLESYRQSYFPQLGDKPKTVADKAKRLEGLLDAAYQKAGRAAPKEAQPQPSMTMPAQQGWSIKKKTGS
jgi:hypothetical protein